MRHRTTTIGDATAVRRQAGGGRRALTAGARVASRPGPSPGVVTPHRHGELAAATPEEKFLARQGQRRSGATSHCPAEAATGPRPRQRGHHPRARPRRARGRGRRPARSRDARRCAPSSRSSPCSSARSGPASRPTRRPPRPHRAEQLKRLDGVATILAKTAARDTSLLELLAEDAVVSDAATLAQARHAPRRRHRAAARGPTGARRGRRLDHDRAPRRPQSVVSRQLANPFLAPDFSAAAARVPPARAAGQWELLGPLLRPFEHAAAARRPAWTFPSPSRSRAPGGLELMRHQAQLVAAAAAGHRTFLLADEPGLGKTAQALLAAEAADAYPLLVVVPNVVKTNWAREAGLWTPNHPRHRDPRRRPHDRRLRRHRHRQLRGARPARGLARRPRLPRHGRRRGALHQEQVRRSAPSTCSQLSERIRARIAAAAADGADRAPR